MPAPFRPRDYAPRDADQSFWDGPQPRMTFVEDTEADIYGSGWFALGAIAIVVVTIIVPGFIYVAQQIGGGN
ncbi:hypothetical protein M527_07160 [Sphingobium indicum IP26]|uniref:hypothetical protein n=1 Tax=Sphingobium TaxID=165695 RepID=UPI000366DBAA|nr:MULTISPECIES: hypothetical protein [Sphingobium]EPR09895.1 hypothetical protein M527_07160 [Sphingobium indicum IP26]